MTVIVGYRDKSGGYIMGDSSVFSSDTVSIVAEPKVWRADGWLVGYCGAMYLAEEVRIAQVGDPYKVRELVAQKWIDGPNAWTSDNAGLTSEFMCINETGLFVVDDGFAVVRSREKYAAIGAGAHCAMGALYALEAYQMSPRERLKLAIKAAATHTPYVRPPFNFLQV